MATFVMQKYWEAEEKLYTDDLITAIKYASNYEADLYMDGRLIMSPLGWEHDYTKEVLAKHGVIQYYQNRRLQWKYADESKNKNLLYAHYHFYIYEGKNLASVTIHDYRQSKADVEFKSIEDFKVETELLYGEESDEIRVSCFLENELWDLLYVKGTGWLNERMYYIVGVQDDEMPSPPRLLCVHGNNKELAIETYKEKYSEKLFDDELDKIKVFGTSRSFVGGDLLGYLSKENEYAR